MSDAADLEPDCDDGADEDERLSDSPEDGFYDVTWTVHVALAVATGKEAEVAVAPGGSRKQKERSGPALETAPSCLHVEHKLLPSDVEPGSVDIVLFGPLAKMYMKDETKTVKTWYEENLIWISWTQEVNVQVGRNLLIELLHEKMKLQIWNAKERVCSQADRLKVCRPPQEQPEDTCGAVDAMVTQIRRSCKNQSTAGGSRSGPVPNPNTELSADAIQSTKDWTSVELSPVRYFAGETSEAQHFVINSSGVSEILWSISLDKPLMSERLAAELRPLVISVISASSMPSTPVSHHTLQEKCTSVYCQYKFHKLGLHRTNSRRHAAKIYFRDVNVILCGLMSPGELQEVLSGPALQIEVHDRDRKEEDALESMKRMEQKHWFNHHGVASLDLSDLLHGKTSIQKNLPIKSCSLPPLLDRGRSAANRSLSDNVAPQPVPPGHYTRANSQLKVKVELNFPLSIKRHICRLAPCGAFGRIVYVFDYSNFCAMTRLRAEILEINASAFHLSSQQALSNHTLHFKPDASGNLDFVTGFHLLDRKKHIFVLEGLKQKAIRRLWEKVPMKLSGNEEEQVMVCYNSGLAFYERIYDTLDLGLTPVYLREPLESIVKQPRICIRGTVCLQALSRLSQLRGLRQLSHAVQYNLFPSADMILSMISQFGRSVEQLERRAEPNTQVDVPTLSVRRRRRSAPGAHISNSSSQRKDFIQVNIRESERLQQPKQAVFRMEAAEGRPVHNYSIQTYNSSEHARKQLLKMMAKVPGRRFTYSQQYHSATVEPGRHHLSASGVWKLSPWTT